MPFSSVPRSGPSRALLLLLAVLAVGLSWSAFLRFPGLQDNDFPLLMWLAQAASLRDPSPLAIGHYPPLQLVWARLAGPLFGGTLLAAKLLNVVATLVSACLVARIAARLCRVEWAGVLAALTFAASTEAMLTGQSEFGDPAALACWLAGLCALLEARTRLALLVGGLLLGLAGSVRLHLESFGFATALVAVALHRSIDDPAERAPRGALTWLLPFAGLVVGLLPSWAVNVLTHGRPFSAVAHTFIGQVLFGFDVDDLPGTFAGHPFREVLAQHKLRLVSLIGTRLAEAPGRWSALLLLAVAVALPRRGPQSSRQRLLAVWVLLLGYAAAIIGPSWTATPRLLMPAAALLAILASAGLALAVPPRLRTAAFGVLLLLLAARFPGERWATLRQLRESDLHWRRSQQITAVLRQHGVREPREVFALDWNRYLTDDPRLISLYNFGFWNLLDPKFREERPSPFPFGHDPTRFAAFLRAHGVLAIVLPKANDRWTELVAIARGRGELPGFRRVASLEDDAVFATER